MEASCVETLHLTSLRSVKQTKPFPHRTSRTDEAGAASCCLPLELMPCPNGSR